MVEIHWENGKGSASYGGVTFDLSVRPYVMAGLDMVHLAAGVARVRASGEDERALGVEEQEKFMRRVVQAAEDGWDAVAGHSTLAVVFQ